MRFLIVGDVVGRPGRRILQEKLPYLRKTHAVDAVIVNGENAAAGLGITPQVCEEILDMGVDVITSGNHIWDKKEILEYIAHQPRLLRPLNYPEGVPGQGGLLLETRGIPWAVISLNGRVFMNSLDCPFRRVEEHIAGIPGNTKVVIVDFHAEATSEKIAMAWYLDGKVSCLVGTHTHVPTADEQLFPRGMAYISDIGMTGAHNSIIGVEVKQILHRFLTQMPVKNIVAKENLFLNGVLVDVDNGSGKAKGIQRISVQ